MIDARLLRDDPESLREAQRRRGESPELVDELVAADEARRTAIATFERARSEQKNLGKLIPKAQGEEKQALLAQTKELSALVKTAESEQAESGARFEKLLKALPNPTSPDAPQGGEDDFVVLETAGTPRDFAAEGFEPLDHLDLGKKLGAFDVERGVKVSGSRFYFLTGVGAQLELALTQLAMSRAAEWGFTPMITPALVKPRAMEGTGFLGQAADDVYHLEKDDLYLVGTSEVALAAYHSDEILEGDVPKRYVAFSPCYRREAGSYGKDTRGIFRVHWFDKVEMFVYTTLEESHAEHERLLGWEKQWLDDLELPYRVIDVATGDLGLSAIRKFDCEAWIPTQGRYREVSSASNCTQFQARRLDTRLRTDEGTVAAATLNGTLCAMPRTIIALLENGQQADGSVRLPAVLHPYLGEILEPIA
ncbi:serine--tRNA ligase [Aeromicrobium sp. CF4.19]|uniref:serine--tRNA ligase n=1 Tax=Aeromicrobium sp. CF4.19 TaxID=3373082 RepID=UPI003EE6381F